MPVVKQWTRGTALFCICAMMTMSCPQWLWCSIQATDNQTDEDFQDVSEAHSSIVISRHTSLVSGSFPPHTTHDGCKTIQIPQPLSVLGLPSGAALLRLLKNLQKWTCNLFSFTYWHHWSLLWLLSYGSSVLSKTIFHLFGINQDFYVPCYSHWPSPGLSSNCLHISSHGLKAGDKALRFH